MNKTEMFFTIDPEKISPKPQTPVVSKHAIDYRPSLGEDYVGGMMHIEKLITVLFFVLHRCNLKTMSLNLGRNFLIFLKLSFCANVENIQHNSITQIPQSKQELQLS